MKSFLLLLAAFTITATSQSQVTLLSNNTNLQTGFVFNGKAILISNSDSIWTTDGTVAATYKLLDNVMYADSGGALYKLFLFHWCKHCRGRTLEDGWNGCRHSIN